MPNRTVRVFVIPIGAAELRAKVVAFRSLIESGGNLARVVAVGAELYDMLISPAADAVDQCKRLVISPDGFLYSLPFGAMVKAGELDSSPRYLAIYKPLHVVSSATVYGEVKKTRPSKRGAVGTLVAFGDPDYRAAENDAPSEADVEVAALRRRGVRFEPLPGTRREVEGVARLFGRNAQVFLGSEATETRAKSVTTGVRFIHFACHGVLDERFPLDSALVMSLPRAADGAADNGLLQAREVIEGMRLDADLVTLSACNSAVGAELGGEGLVGLTLAFQYAGARSVLGSLWAVSDASTAILMVSFYSALFQGASKDEALRAAQLAMMHDPTFSHPVFWAAFEIIGDWR